LLFHIKNEAEVLSCLQESIFLLLITDNGDRLWRVVMKSHWGSQE